MTRERQQLKQTQEQLEEVTRDRDELKQQLRRLPPIASKSRPNLIANAKNSPNFNRIQHQRSTYRARQAR